MTTIDTAGNIHAPNGEFAGRITNPAELDLARPAVTAAALTSEDFDSVAEAARNRLKLAIVRFDKNDVESVLRDLDRGSEVLDDVWGHITDNNRLRAVDDAVTETGNDGLLELVRSEIDTAERITGYGDSITTADPTPRDTFPLDRMTLAEFEVAVRAVRANSGDSIVIFQEADIDSAVDSFDTAGAYVNRRALWHKLHNEGAILGLQNDMAASGMETLGFVVDDVLAELGL